MRMIQVTCHSLDFTPAYVVARGNPDYYECQRRPGAQAARRPSMDYATLRHPVARIPACAHRRIRKSAGMTMTQPMCLDTALRAYSITASRRKVAKLRAISERAIRLLNIPLGRTALRYALVNLFLIGKEVREVIP